jgi:DNA-directed RNA polymerase specialized sigma24 family protein
MPENIDFSTLSLSSLCYRCARESDRFFSRKKHDPRFCFQLFRRAVLDQDQRAWECLYRQYNPLVASWVERHALFRTCNEERQYFVNRAFEKMWAAFSPQKLDRFSDLKSILRYLQMCVHSAVVDYLRAQEQAELMADHPSLERESFDGDALSPEKEAVRRTQAADLWEMITARLKDEKERKVIYGSFILALKPGDLVDYYADTFKNVGEIYRLKENVLARFRRDEDLKHFLNGV